MEMYSLENVSPVLSHLWIRIQMKEKKLVAL